MSDFIVRETDPYASDLETYIARVFEEDYVEKVGGPSAWEKWTFSCKNVSGEIVGLVEGDYWFGGAVINRFAVKSGWRTCGVGSQLMRHVLHHVRSLGAHVISVMTFDFQAPDFYKRFGFRVDIARPGWGERTGYYLSLPLSGTAGGEASPEPDLTVVDPSGHNTTVSVSNFLTGRGPLTPDQDEELQHFFREQFDEYSMSKLQRTAQYFPWAFEAVLEYAPSHTGALASEETRGTRTLLRAGIIEGKSYWNGFVISHLCVEKGMRGRGIARALLERALQHGADKGCTIATVETMSFQCPEMYKRFGFTNDANVGGWDVPQPAARAVPVHPPECEPLPATLHFFFKDLRLDLNLT